MGRIVVGFDSSPESISALRFALAEARVRHATVAAVLAWSIPLAVDVPGGMLPELTVDFEKEAEAALAHGLEGIDTEGVELERRAVEGPAARVLLHEAEGADLLVVGSRGHGGFHGLLLGSVSQQLAHHAPCPLVVVPRGAGG
jgi:nucleotide-binding universal stress UspA family protein